MDDTLTRTELVASGWTGRAITGGVRTGVLVRVRRGHYATAATSLGVHRAVRVGGRLACVSELRHRGVWVHEPEVLHVQVARHASRLRSPDYPTIQDVDGGCLIHWHPLLDLEAASPSHVGVVDALARAVRCLPRREGVAAIDSAVNQNLVTADALRRLFLTSRLRAALAEADPAAQSGLETIVRLVARDLGLRVRSQVRFPGIGVVDLVIEGWVVVETDGSQFHDPATVAPRDRRRDARHAAAGRTALRFRYAQIVYEVPTVVAAIIGAVGSHRRVHNSGRIAARATRRSHRIDFT